MTAHFPAFAHVVPRSPYRTDYSPQSASLIDAQESLRTLRDWVRYAVSRLQAAGASFGHGTDNAYDEAIWLVCWCLHLPVEQYEDLASATICSSPMISATPRLKFSIMP